MTYNEVMNHILKGSSKRTHMSRSKFSGSLPLSFGEGQITPLSITSAKLGLFLNIKIAISK